LTVENIEILIKCIPKPEVARHNLETKHSNNNFDIRVSLLFFFFFRRVILQQHILPKFLSPYL
jgi:hypothetical protein